MLCFLESLFVCCSAALFSLWGMLPLFSFTTVFSFLFYILGIQSLFFFVLILFLLLYLFFYTLYTTLLSFLSFLLLFFLYFLVEVTLHVFYLFFEKESLLSVFVDLNFLAFTSSTIHIYCYYLFCQSFSLKQKCTF